MNSADRYTSPEAVAGLLDLVRAGEPVLDVTYGNGSFWGDGVRNVIGSDRNPCRARNLAADFTALPLRRESVPTVVYDPPFHPSVSSDERHRYSEMGRNGDELRVLFVAGLMECWRVTSRHLLVKCQGFVHNHRPHWMELWACAALGEPFEWLTAYRSHKKISGRWKNVRSLRRNHATYLLFDKRGNLR